MFRRPGEYVAPEGSHHSYTRKLEEAQTYTSREIAEQDRCGNETIVAVEEPFMNAMWECMKERVAVEVVEGRGRGIGRRIVMVMKRFTISRAALEYSSTTVEAETEAEAIQKAKDGAGEWHFESYEGDGYLEENIPGLTEYAVISEEEI